MFYARYTGIPYYTYKDWERWEGKWEIIHGIPYAMSPAPIPWHQIISNALGSELRQALRKCNTYKAMQPVDNKISDDTIVQPDLLVVCGKITKSFLDFPPALIAEILSPATALKDRHNKYKIYESQQIGYYIIVSIETEETEIYELTSNEYQLVKKGHDIQYTFSFTNDCTATIDFNEIWE